MTATGGRVVEDGVRPSKEDTLARVTLQTIADELGVSRMTVSNAFSRPDQLSAEMRDRVLAAASRLGYAGPDPAARALARGRTGVVGMVLTEDPSDAFRDDVAVGFVRAAAEALAVAGYSLALLHRGNDHMLPARDVAMDGAIVYACTPQSDAMQHLQRRGLPIVRVEGQLVEGVADVSIDDRAGAAAAARHLVDLGHRRVAIVTSGLDVDGGRPVASDSELAPIARRLDGWLSALGEADSDVRAYGTPGTYVDDLLVERIGHALDWAPTAVLAYSDLAALEVLDQARARDLRVPDDLSIVGFDDNPLAARSRPTLTTVRQDLQAKGTLAVRSLLSQLAGEAPHHEPALPTTLVVRDSTAPPPR